MKPDAPSLSDRRDRRGFCLLVAMAGAAFVAMLFALFLSRSSSVVAPVRAARAEAPPPPAGGPRARIAFSCGLPGELSLRPAGSAATWNFTSSNSVFDVPAGRYRLWYYTCRATDAQGGVWTARTGLDSRDDEPFDLAEGAERTVTGGPPFVVSVAASPKPDGELALDLRCADAAGDAYRIQRDGARTPNPSFAIADRDGRTVASGTFEFG